MANERTKNVMDGIRVGISEFADAFPSATEAVRKQMDAFLAQIEPTVETAIDEGLAGNAQAATTLGYLRDAVFAASAASFVAATPSLSAAIQRTLPLIVASVVRGLFIALGVAVV